MKMTPSRKLAENIGKGIRAGVKKALLEHKKAGRSIVVWENGKVKKIPASKIKVED
jgi:hypothetical protein